MLKFPKNDKMINTLKTQEHGLDLFFFQIILKYLANKAETNDGIFFFFIYLHPLQIFKCNTLGIMEKGGRGRNIEEGRYIEAWEKEGDQPRSSGNMV